jgi:phosphoribosylformylglycinamidine (FGAM) synthase PurS component
MQAELADNSIQKFISLDIEKRESKEILPQFEVKDMYERLFENEWLQEYELIYSLQELEDWNLEGLNNI